MYRVAFNSLEEGTSLTVQNNLRRFGMAEVSRHLAYTIGNNLYVMTGDGQTLKVTNEPEGIVCGQSVHRNEFGISKGTFWNPAGDCWPFIE